MGLRLNPGEVKAMTSSASKAVSKYNAELRSGLSGISGVTNERGLQGKAYSAFKFHMADHTLVVSSLIAAGEGFIKSLSSISAAVGAEVLDEDKLNKSIKLCIKSIERYDRCIETYRSLLNDPTYYATSSGHAYSMISHYQDLKEKYETLKKKLEEKLKKLFEIDAELTGIVSGMESLYNGIEAGIRSLEKGWNGTAFIMPVAAAWRAGLLSKFKDTIYRIITQLKNSVKGANNTQCCLGGDPVNLATGNFIYDKEDLVIPGRTSFVFRRFYNSINDYKGAFGCDFNHNYELRLDIKEDDDGQVGATIHFEDGQEDTFIQVEDDRFESYYGTLGSFERVEDEQEDSFKGYSYTKLDGTKYLFNRDGLYTRQEDSNGNGFTLEYEDGGRLVKVIKDSGEYFALSYNEEGHTSEVRDHTGRCAQYLYENNKLTKVVLPGGNEITYEYSHRGKLKAATNPRGIKVLSNIFDGQDRTIQQEFPDGTSISYKYDDENQTVTMIERNGSKSVYYHDEAYRNTKVEYPNGTEEFTYNDKNQRTKVKDRNGNETKHEYDDRGNRTATVTALVDRYEFEYDDENRCTKVSLNGDTLRVFEYSESGRLTSETDALGRTVKTEYDEKNLIETVTLADGTVISYENDAQGNISKLIDENGNEWRYSYDKLNRVTEAVDGCGNTESFEYNDRSEITKMTNAAGDSRVYEYNPSGKLTHSIDFDGNEEFAEYNELNKISKYTDKDGFVTSFEYDKMWNLAKTVDAEGGVNLYTYDGDGRVISVTDANFNTKEYSRDANGNVIRESDEDGNYIKYEYDALNRVKTITYKDGTEEHIEYDALGNEVKFIDAAGNEWKSEYNLEGELTRRINPEGLETVYAYDNRGSLISEETESLITKYEYDRAGNLIKRVNPDGTSEEYSYDANGNMIGRTAVGVHFSFEYDCLNRLTEVKREGERLKYFEYDKVGNRIAVTDALGNTTKYIRSKAGDILTAIDPLGHETHYTYDKCHRLIGIDQGEGRVTRYTRDKVGNVLTVTDALGNTEKYEYDCNNNVIAKTDMDGNRTTIGRNIYGDVAKIKYADSTEVEYSYDSLRRLKEVKDSLGITTIERDILGRETKVTDHKGRAVSYSYDKVGHRTGITYPSGKHVVYEFDKYGRNTKIKTDDVEASMSNDAFGRIEERKSSNLLTLYAYDKLGRLSELTHKRNNEIIHSEILHYDAEDNVLSDGKSHFEYDKLGRLTKATGKDGNVREYYYDAYGNRTSLTENGNTVTYLYDEANQLLSASNGLSFKYDRRGNVIEKSHNGEILNTYIYGVNNRLERAVNAKGDMASYSYNGLGRRVSRRAGSTEIDYILDQTKMYNNLLEADGDSFVWDENNLLFRNHETEIRDRLGSPIGMDEFGAKTDAGTLGFTGYMYDDVSGTYFAQAREYMPEVGRFTGRDIVKGTILQPLTLNNYQYCYSNPSKYVDWDGRMPELLDDALNIWSTLNSKTGRTYSTGISIGGSYVTAGVSLSAGIIVDSRGNVAISFTHSYRAGATGIGANACKYKNWTDANSIYDVDGWSDLDIEVGASSPIPTVPLSGSMEYSSFTGEDNRKKNGLTTNVGVGVGGLPISIAGGQTRTWIIPVGNVNINESRGCMD